MVGRVIGKWPVSKRGCQKVRNVGLEAPGQEERVDFMRKRDQEAVRFRGDDPSMRKCDQEVVRS